MALVATLAGCATPPPAEDADARALYEEMNDPFEPTNRAIFAFNQGLDKMLLKPVAMAYRDLTPPEFQDGVHNFLANLRTPVRLANDILQGNLDRAGTTVQRFLINSTAGVGGFFDVAADLGIEGHTEDFGQTLAVWGSGEGPYLVLPVLGPSNPRDAIGLLGDSLMDPFTYTISSELQFARFGVRGLDQRKQVIDTLDEIERTSLDFYATLRSLYRQRRNDEIRNGRPAPLVPVPALSFEDLDEADSAALTLND